MLHAYNFLCTLTMKIIHWTDICDWIYKNPRTFEATVLQSGDSRKIDLYSDHMGKNYRQIL